MARPNARKLFGLMVIPCGVVVGVVVDVVGIGLMPLLHMSSLQTHSSTITS